MTRLETIAAAFLRYLYDDSHFRPEVSGFLSSPHAHEITPPVSSGEFDHVLRRLLDRELIAAPRDTAEEIPARAGLTGFGLICVDHFGGDVVAWAQQQDSSVAVLPDDAPPERTPHVRSEPGPQPVPIMVPPRGGPRTTPTPEAPLSGLTRVARVILLTLPTVQVRHGETDATEQTAQNLLAAIRQPHPDPRRIRLLTRKLRHELAHGPVANTLGAVLLDSLDEAIRESDLF